MLRELRNDFFNDGCSIKMRGMKIKMGFQLGVNLVFVETVF